MKAVTAKNGSPYHPLLRATASFLNPGRCVFFIVHVLIHLCGYVLPRLFLWCVLWGPLDLAEYVLLQTLARLLWDEAVVDRMLAARAARKQRERLVKIVAHPTHHATLRAFGLEPTDLYEGLRPTVAATSRPPPQYDGPLYNGHIHTILGAFRAFEYLAFQRETVRSFDGNPICLDYLFPETEREWAGVGGRRARRRQSRRRRTSIKALVVVLPGLTGTSREFYVQRMARALYCASTGVDGATHDGGNAAQGDKPARREYNNIQIVVLNARGVGDTPLEKPQIFSALFTKDLRYVLENELTPSKVRDKFGLTRDIPIIGLAFSLGGLILANYCGEEGLRAMRAEGVHVDDGERFSASVRNGVEGRARDDHHHANRHYGGGRQPLPDPVPAERPPNVLDAAITVTSPHNLLDGDVAMNTLLSRLIYGKAFTGNLMSYYRAHKDVIARLPGVRNREALFNGTPIVESGVLMNGHLPAGHQQRGHPHRRQQPGHHHHGAPHPSPPRRRAPLIDSLSSVREFDELVTAPHFGFGSCFEYYAAADNFKKFPFSLRTKLMCVVAANDPICGPPQPPSRYADSAERLERNRMALNAAQIAARAASAGAASGVGEAGHPPSSPPPIPATEVDRRETGDGCDVGGGGGGGRPCVAGEDSGGGVPGWVEEADVSGAGTHSTALHAEHVSNDGGLVYVEFPVGGHLGFVGTPLAELVGRPNEMELFVARALTSVIRNWYVERDLDYGCSNDASGELAGAEASEDDSAWEVASA